MATGWTYSSDGVTLTFTHLPVGINLSDYFSAVTFDGSTYSADITNAKPSFLRLKLRV